MYGDLGFDLLESLKEAAAAGVAATKASLLTRGGTAIAASPEGQAAIKQSLIEQAQTKGRTVAQGIPLSVLLGAGGLVLYFAFFRRRRRR